MEVAFQNCMVECEGNIKGYAIIRCISHRLFTK